MKRRHKDDRKRRPARRPRRLPARAIVVALVLVAVAAAAWLALRLRSPRPTRDGHDALTPAAMAESTRAAYAVKDWAAALHWARHLAGTDPSNPSLGLGLGLAWHNLAWGGAGYGRERTATRTSLDRVEMERRALALMDTATAHARDETEWVRSSMWLGQTYENVGLPLDALAIYARVRERQPRYGPVESRMTWVLNSLRDPLGTTAAPDSVLR